MNHQLNSTHLQHGNKVWPLHERVAHDEQLLGHVVQFGAAVAEQVQPQFDGRAKVRLVHS